MTTLEHVLSEHVRLTEKGFNLVETKGRDLVYFVCKYQEERK